MSTPTTLGDYETPEPEPGQQTFEQVSEQVTPGHEKRIPDSVNGFRKRPPNAPGMRAAWARGPVEVCVIAVRTPDSMDYEVIRADSRKFNAGAHIKTSETEREAIAAATAYMADYPLSK